MVNLKYISSNGIEFDLHDFNSAKLFTAAFHDVEWIPETVSRQYGVTVNRFTKEPRVFDCTFRFKGDVAQRKAQIDSFIFETYGWGHGVGMSQHGAGIYADQGKDFEFILKHYYSNTELTLWN